MCVSLMEFRAQNEFKGQPAAPQRTSHRIVFYSTFFLWPVTVFSDSIDSSVLPMGNATPQYQKIQLANVSDEFCSHFSLLNRILIPCPPQNSEQFFFLLSADTLQILADTSHIPLESLFGTVLCLWFLLTPLINRTPSAFTASNLPSPGKRQWERPGPKW